jgi:hypothetical protein
MTATSGFSLDLPRSWPLKNKCGYCFPVAGGTFAAGVASFFADRSFRAMARTFFFAAFLCADFRFRVRMARFVVALRFPDMSIPFVTATTLRRSCGSYLREL